MDLEALLNERAGTWFLIVGPPETGKSNLARHIADEQPDACTLMDDIKIDEHMLLTSHDPAFYAQTAALELARSPVSRVFVLAAGEAMPEPLIDLCDWVTVHRQGLPPHVMRGGNGHWAHRAEAALEDDYPVPSPNVVTPEQRDLAASEFVRVNDPRVADEYKDAAELIGDPTKSLTNTALTIEEATRILTEGTFVEPPQETFIPKIVQDAPMDISEPTDESDDPGAA